MKKLNEMLKMGIRSEITSIRVAVATLDKDLADGRVDEETYKILLSDLDSKTTKLENYVKNLITE